MKRLLVMSHAGVLDVNRAVFQKLAEIADVDVTMIVPEQWKGDLIRDLAYEKSENDGFIKVIPLPIAMSGNGSLFFYVDRLKKIRQQIQPDFLFLDEEPWSLAALQAFRVFKDVPKCFFTKQNLKKTVPLPFKISERWVFSASTFAYAVAGEVEEVLQWKGYKKDVRILPHSYDPRLFKPLSNEERTRRRDELGIPREALVLSYFGRLTEEKGIDELVQAARDLSSDPRLNHLFFLFVGNGPLRAKAEGIVAELSEKRAKFCPAIPHSEVGRTLAMTDVLVLPSRTATNWKEQFGRILVEAMACGAMTVGSDSGEIPHLIRRAGGGVSFPERNAAALASTLGDLAKNVDKIREFKESGRRYVEENLTHAAVARSLAKDLGLRLKAKA